MKCFHPITLVLDGRRQFVPCGKCNFCLEQRRAHWSFRLQMEMKYATDKCYFVTLTYNDQKIPITPTGLPTLEKSHFQLFLKRFRHYAPERSVRYYAVGEYGSRTSRPHYHALLFNIPLLAIQNTERVWRLGQVYVGTVTPASIHYVAKYHVNAISDQELNGRAPPFALMSRKPGIGAGYFESHTEWHIYADRLYTQIDGFKRSLPRYYRNKMFADRIIDVSQLPSEVKVYYDELEKLSHHHSDPHAYYNEQRRHAHDSVKHKSNSKDKL